MASPRILPPWYGYSESDDQSPRRSAASELFSAVAAVESLLAVGIAAPPGWSKLTAGISGLQNLIRSDERPLLQQLVESVKAGQVDPRLLADAKTECDRTHLADVATPAHALLLDEVLALWEPQKDRAYAEIARRVNFALDAFVKCASLADPGAAPDEIIDATPKVLAAWKNSLTHAAALDGLVDVLCCAAELLRDRDAPAGYGATKDAMLIPLVCNPGGVSPRRLFAAWRDLEEPAPPTAMGAVIMRQDLEPKPEHKPTRGSRWTRLHRCGVLLRAEPEPRSMALLDPAAPYVAVEVAPPGPADNIARKTWQIIDPDKPAPRRSALARLRSMMSRTPQLPHEPPNIMETVPDAGDEPAKPAAPEWHDDEGSGSRQWKPVTRYDQ